MIKHLLLQAAAGQLTSRPPVWIMRQAGRILPEYRQLRSHFKDFKDFLYHPEATAEATLQPISALGVDAAILFSDILVIPECMGFDYNMVESRGPVFENTFSNAKDLSKIPDPVNAIHKLSYVFDAASIVKKELSDSLPLIGFSGAPWTLFAYMVEGKGSKDFAKAKKMLYQNPELSHKFLQKITDTIIAYLREKINHGCNIVQLFDSWAGVLTPKQFEEFSLYYIKQINDAINDVPVIVFAKGANGSLHEIGKLQPKVIGLDWGLSLDISRNILGDDQVLQGNADPCLLYSGDDEIVSTVNKMINNGGRKYIANLGHGVYPDMEASKVKLFVDTVKAWHW